MIAVVGRLYSNYYYDFFFFFSVLDIEVYLISKEENLQQVLVQHHGKLTGMRKFGHHICLKGIVTHSREATLSNCLYLPSEKGLL